MAPKAKPKRKRSRSPEKKSRSPSPPKKRSRSPEKKSNGGGSGSGSGPSGPPGGMPLTSDSKCHGLVSALVAAVPGTIRVRAVKSPQHVFEGKLVEIELWSDAVSILNFHMNKVVDPAKINQLIEEDADDDGKPIAHGEITKASDLRYPYLWRAIGKQYKGPHLLFNLSDEQAIELFCLQLNGVTDELYVHTTYIPDGTTRQAFAATFPRSNMRPKLELATPFPDILQKNLFEVAYFGQNTNAKFEATMRFK